MGGWENHDLCYTTEETFSKNLVKHVVKGVPEVIQTGDREWSKEIWKRNIKSLSRLQVATFDKVLHERDELRKKQSGLQTQLRKNTENSENWAPAVLENDTVFHLQTLHPVKYPLSKIQPKGKDRNRDIAIKIQLRNIV